MDEITFSSRRTDLEGIPVIPSWSTVKKGYVIPKLELLIKLLILIVKF